MSIVLNLVSSTRSWIMSDGLAKNSATEDVISGSLQKFEVIHPLLCIGFTGTLEFAQSTINAFKLTIPKGIALTIEPSADLIVQIAATLQEQTHTRAQFLVTGISEKGCLGTITVSSENRCMTLIPKGKNLLFSCLGNQENFDLTPYLVAQQKIGAKDVDSMIQKAMGAAIRDISKVDNTVNQTTFFRVLRLPK